MSSEVDEGKGVVEIKDSEIQRIAKIEAKNMQYFLELLSLLN